MLPVPAIRVAAPRQLRHWLKTVDSYTRWAFNAQPPLVPPATDRRDDNA